MQMKLKILCVCLASYLGTLCAVETSDATAQTPFRRFAANGACTTSAGTLLALFGRMKSANGGTLGLECGMPTDSELAHKDVSLLVMHGYRASGTTYLASACVTGNFGLGYACGSSAGPSTGDFTHYLNTSVWTNTTYANWYPFISVAMDGANNLQGFYMRD